MLLELEERLDLEKWRTFEERRKQVEQYNSVELMEQQLKLLVLERLERLVLELPVSLERLERLERLDPELLAQPASVERQYAILSKINFDAESIHTRGLIAFLGVADERIANKLYCFLSH